MVKPVSSAPNFDDIASFTVSGAAGDFIYREGEPGKDMFIIQDGRIEILNQESGAERALDVLEVGDFFGELSLLEDQRRDASTRAMTPFRLLRIDRTTLHRLVQENPDIAVRMLHRLASRLREHEEARLRAAEIAAGAMSPLPNRDAAANPPSMIMRSPVAEPFAAAPEAIAADGVQPEEPRAVARRPRLVHSESGREFPLTADGDLAVGRLDRSTGYVPPVDLTALDTNRTLSRRHAAITVRDDGVYLCEPKATRNGTFVNGQRVTPAEEVRLRNGDVIQFGLVETVFQDD
jgi:CRP/FNR family transcriptional regulator, cyclic AMP receptor protein